MAGRSIGTIAILYPGDRETRRTATPDNNRLATVFRALQEAGIEAVPAVYSDPLRDEVREQLRHVDGVLVWRNPIQDGSDRSVLDPMLREVADSGVFVSAHPDVILKMGTKEVLYTTRSMGWGSDTHLHPDLESLRSVLPGLLSRGPRVLKQLRGNGGDGVWRVELAQGSTELVRVRHAKRGALEEVMPLAAAYGLFAPYFEKGGRMIDQEYQPRLKDGMIRCYLTQGVVVGFGHQEINALYPTPEGGDPKEALQPSQRLYHPPDQADFEELKRKVESWVPEMQALLALADDDLPLLWDCDFLLGPRDAQGRDTYVLCEINVSSVAPYPESAPPFIARAVVARLKGKRA